MRRICGIKPTGKIHLGNYFGAIKKINHSKDNLYFIANYHALTSSPNPDELRIDSLDIFLDYLALGLDRDTIFFQSAIPEHCELTWILSSLTPMGLLQRAHAYKDSMEKNLEVNAALFSYPVLMAADILMYDTDLVAVGKDQKQHVEIARDLAIKFNNKYGNIFKLPEAEIEDDVIQGTDGRKMSKSYNNTIPVFADEKSIKQAIYSIVTDSKSVDEEKDPNTCNIYGIYKLFLNEQEQETLKERYKYPLGYGELKKELFERVISFLSPLQKKREELLKNMDYVYSKMKQDNAIARNIAQKKMEIVKKSVGLI